MKPNLYPTLSKSVLSSFLGAFLVLFSINATHAQVSVQDSIPIEQIVNEFLLGDSIGATNIVWNVQSPGNTMTNQAGIFTVDSSAFPISEGVVLATGSATGIAGGNDITFGNSWDFDADLQAITGQNVNNCAIIEFDFTSATDTFVIDYVFASTEYPNFTCSSFNDAFGIFVSGPGIDGPFTNGAENIALIPNSSTPVAINTVNGGAPSSAGNTSFCLDANPNFVEDSIYFINNSPNLENSIVYPGHTHMFTAVAVLTPGETYHFKIAIANAADQALQSAVMMRRGSVSGVNTQGLLTLDVNTEGIEVDPEGIFVAATFNYFVPEPMEQIGPHQYRIAAPVAPYTNVTYKFFNGNGPNAAELIPDECSIDGAMPDGSRHLTMPQGSLVMDPICFGTCEVCATFLDTENLATEKLKLFPNPSYDGRFQLNAPLDGPVRMQLFDIRGKLVMDQRTFLNQGALHSFQLPGQSTGLYHFQMYYESNPQQRYTSKVVLR